MKVRNNKKVTNTTEYKKDEVCKCKSCNRSFHQSEIKREQSEHLIHSKGKGMCPYCNNKNFVLIDYPICEEELIYKNGKFFDNSGIHIKRRIDKLMLEEE